MKVLAAAVMSLSTVLSLCLFISVFVQQSLANASSVPAGFPSASGADAPSLTITRGGSAPSDKAPDEHFTDAERIDRRFRGPVAGDTQHHNQP